MRVGYGTWNSEALRSPWRARVEEVEAGEEPASRTKAARRILRDGPDLAALMVMDIWQRHCPDRRWGVDNPFDPLIGAMRHRAAKILNREGEVDARSATQALQLLAWNGRRKDVHLFLRYASHHDAGARAHAFDGLAWAGPHLDEGLTREVIAWARELVGSAASSYEEQRLAGMLGELTHPEVRPLLERGLATLSWEAGRWAYLRSLLFIELETYLPVVDAAVRAIAPDDSSGLRWRLLDARADALAARERDAAEADKSPG